MKASFCVLTEPWIPVLDFKGQLSYVGMREALKNAHEYSEISDEMPHIEYSLYRLLSVFLMDMLQPEDEQDLMYILEKGRFDSEQIESYIGKCREEGVTFDLFDDKRPFLQTPYCEEWDKVKKPASVLDITIPSGNNHVHFDHRSSDTITFTYAQAARLLPTLQMFCTSGAQGYPSGVNGAPPYFTLIKGRNLFETLVYSLIPLQDIFSVPFDNPPVVWRCTDIVQSKKVVLQTSWLYGMLFPARRVLLIPDTEHNWIAQVYLSQGLNYEMKNWIDPHVTYRVNNKGRMSWKPNGSKMIWRNLCDLVNIKDGCAPQILAQCQRIYDAPYIEVVLYGIQTEQASYIEMERYDLQIVKALLNYPERVYWLQQCIEQAEKLASALRAALNVETKGKSTGIPPNVCQQAQQQFYNRCEDYFWQLCNCFLAQEQVDLQECWDNWKAHIISAALEVNKAAWEMMTLRAADLVTATQKQGILFAQITKLKKVNQA